MSTTDQSIEADIQTKGLTAPRVTPDYIADAIVGTYWFTAAQGAYNAGYRLEPDAKSHPLQLLTFCVLQLRNGFTVTGESACASPENFNADIGRRIARDNAIAKVWPLLGYALRERLAQGGAA